MGTTCTIQDSFHVFSLVHKYVSRILGTYQTGAWSFLYYKIKILECMIFQLYTLTFIIEPFGSDAKCGLRMEAGGHFICNIMGKIQ